MPEIDEIIASTLAEMTGSEAEASADTAPVVETDDAPAEEQSAEELTEPVEEPDEGEDEGTDSGSVTVDLDTVLTLPDGKTVSVKDGIELKADYTRKTQELAEQRKQVEQVYSELKAWSDAVLAQPDEFVYELVREQKVEPVAVASGMLAAATDPTAALARVIKQMLDAGQLSAEFVEAFGLDEPDHTVSKNAQASETSDRIERLERELAERREQEQLTAQQAQLLQDYERQIDDIIANEGLDRSKRDELIVELVGFATENDLVDNLAHAYAVLAFRKEKAAQAEAAAAEKKAAAKRATRVMAPTSSSSTGVAASPERYDSYESAAAAALAELMGKAK